MRQPIYLGGGPLEPVGAERRPVAGNLSDARRGRTEIGPGTNHFVVSPGPLRVCTVALGAYISALVLPLQQRSYSISLRLHTQCEDT